METLPEDLLEMIIDRVGLPDRFRLGYTCKTMFLMCSRPVQIPRHLPFLLVPINNSPSNTMVLEDKDDNVGFFSLFDGKIHKAQIPQLSNRRICGSFPGGWLMTVHENSEVQLFNPFSRSPVIIHLPPLTHFPGVFQTQDLSLYHGTDAFGESFCWDSKHMRDRYIHRVAMSTPSLTASTVIMAIQGKRLTLAFHKIGGDQVWSHATVASPYLMDLSDITYYKGNFYAVHNDGFVVAIRDIEQESAATPYAHLVIAEHSSCSLSFMNYILVSGDDLLVVLRYVIEDTDRDPDNPPHKTVGFKLLKLQFATAYNQWVEVESLGDRALFVGNNSSYSLSSTRAFGCRQNCIYFTDDYGYFSLQDGFGGHDFGIYNLEDGSIEIFLYPSDTLRVMPPPIWFAPPNLSSE